MTKWGNESGAPTLSSTARCLRFGQHLVATAASFRYRRVTCNFYSELQGSGKKKISALDVWCQMLMGGRALVATNCLCFLVDFGAASTPLYHLFDTAFAPHLCYIRSRAGPSFSGRQGQCRRNKFPYFDFLALSSTLRSTARRGGGRLPGSVRTRRRGGRPGRHGGHSGVEVRGRRRAHGGE